MKHYKSYLEKNRHFLLQFLFIPVLLWFAYCEKVVVPKYIVYSKVDDYIPFVKEFIIPYILWYLYIAFSMLYLGFKAKTDYYKLCIYVFTGVSIAYIIYLIFPNAQNLRPIITSNDFLSRVVKYIYSIDTPTNVCPSMHVFIAYAIHMTICSSSELKDKRKVKLFSFVSMLLTSTSTLFVKQHSFVDYVLGMALAVLLYVPLYGISKVAAYRRDKALKPKLLPDNTNN